MKDIQKEWNELMDIFVSHGAVVLEPPTLKTIETRFITLAEHMERLGVDQDDDLCNSILELVNEIFIQKRI
jgi:hypothetical protein